MTVPRHPHEHAARYPTPRNRSQPSDGDGSLTRTGFTVTW